MEIGVYWKTETWQNFGVVTTVSGLLPEDSLVEFLTKLRHEVLDNSRDQIVTRLEAYTAHVRVVRNR